MNRNNETRDEAKKKKYEMLCGQRNYIDYGQDRLGSHKSEHICLNLIVIDQ